MEKTISGNPNVIALIITYNPDIQVLQKNISELSKQVNKILIYDNASKNRTEIKCLVSSFDNIQIIENETNLGLPTNYNRATEQAYKEGYPWLLIMDQDTVVPDHLIASYWQCVQDQDPAIVTPVFWDINKQALQEPLKTIPEEPYTIVDRCMNSASMHRVDVIRSLGGFDEKLFIDYVDYEYCQRVIESGHQIVRVNSCVVEHRLGQAKDIRFLWMTLTLRNYPPIRYYYIIRNLVYLSRKHSSFSEYLYAVSILLKAMIKVSYEEQTKEKRKMLLKGFKDGRTL